MSAEEPKKENLFLLGMVLSMFCWGLSWASGKIMANYGGPLNLSFYRFLVTFISLLLILLFMKQKLTVSGKGFIDLLISALFIGIYTYLFFKGLSAGLAGAGGVLVTVLNPIIAYSLMLLIKWKKPMINEALGIIIGLIAGAILLRIWANWQHLADAGNLYFLLASFTWAILSNFTAKSSRYGTPAAFSLWMYGLCSLLMFLLTDFQSNISIVEKADIYFWGNLIFSSTVTTAMATTFYFVATSKIGASRASSFIFLVPFSAALGGWLFLGEIPQIHTIIGGMLGILAVYIINRKWK